MKTVGNPHCFGYLAIYCMIILSVSLTDSVHILLLVGHWNLSILTLFWQDRSEEIVVILLLGIGLLDLVFCSYYYGFLSGYCLGSILYPVFQILPISLSFWSAV